MQDRITIYGKIGFEPEDKTKKHSIQSSWKRIAMVNFSGDLSKYYAWFILKRFNLPLNPPLRGAHISFINDSIKDLSLNGKRTMEEVDEIWNSVKRKWDKKTIPVTLDINPKFGKEYWWLSVPEEERELLHGIRAELGLGKPFWGLHMTLGYANEKNMFHNLYIQNGIIRGFIP